jgi:dTDP-4-dehydrorhamnose 3,5-epimerase
MTVDKSILQITLAAAAADQRSLNKDGTAIRKLPDGAKIHKRPVHVDDRGELQEIYGASWDLDDIPISHLYMTTIQPGVVKGWNLHMFSQDRYFVITGRMQVVMFDPRPDSPTFGGVFSITLSERNHFVLSVPQNVWHADHNVGTNEVIFVNMPTRPYDADRPDKHRLPIDSPLIPYRFPTAARGY